MSHEPSGLASGLDPLSKSADAPYLVTAYIEQVMADEPLQNMDVVALLSDRPEEGLSAGQTGTVVFVHDDRAAFEVEFMFHSGKSIVTTVRREDLLKLSGLPNIETGASMTYSA